MNRRGYLTVVGMAGIGVSAGCLGDNETDTEEDEPGDGDESSGEGDESTSETDQEGGSDDEHEALLTVDAYVEAAAEQDLEAMSEYMHSYHPFNPENLDEGEEEIFETEYTDLENYERELADEEFDTETIRDDPDITFWFDDIDTTIDEILEGEEAVLVKISYETSENGDTEEEEQFILLTEDGNWRVFLPYEEPAEVPDGDPVDDDEYQLVDEIEFDIETQMATVNVSGTEGVEAEEMVAYSTSLGDDTAIWSEDSDILPSVNFFATAFDPTGDELVVTLRFHDGEEIVIHREAYDPEE